jgi:uncharacterized protein YkwD
MRRRVIARRRPATRTHRRARCAFALAGVIAAAGAPAVDAQTDLAGTLADAVAPATAVAACAAAVAEPGTRSRAALRAALRCAVNAERTAQGLATLRADRHLNRAARRHARDMVRRHYFAHERAGWTLADRLAAAGWTGRTAAEAIAWGCGGRGSALATLRAWLESPGHRAIVLGGYARVGIGLALGTPTSDRCGAAGTWVLDVGA